MKKNRLLFLIPILLLVLIIIFWDKIQNILLELLLGSLLAYMLEPAVYFLTRKNKISRNMAILIVFCILLLTIIGIFIFVIPILSRNISDLVKNLPETMDNLLDKMKELTSNPEINEKISKIAQASYDKILSNISRVIENISGYALDIAGSIIEVVVGILTTFVLAVYMMKDKKQIFENFLGWFPFSWRETVKGTMDELGRILSKFLQGQILIALIIGTAETIGLMLIGVPYAVLLGIIGGISNLIPYFGPVIGAVPAVISAIFISPMKAIWVIILFVAAQQFDNNFLSPRIIQGSLGIHPITTIVVIFIGGEFFALWGILLAVPVYAVLKCIAEKVFTACSYQGR